MGVKGHSWGEKKALRQQAALEKAMLQEIREEREARQLVQCLSLLSPNLVILDR